MAFSWRLWKCGRGEKRGSTSYIQRTVTDIMRSGGNGVPVTEETRYTPFFLSLFFLPFFLRLGLILNSLLCFFLFLFWGSLGRVLRSRELSKKSRSGLVVENDDGHLQKLYGNGTLG